MSEKTPFLKQPQNYIIAILLLGIAGYIGYQQLQPKTNKLAQASAYFDAIDAEERAEAEKKRAAEEKEKARLAAIEMEKAKEEARIAQQKVKAAEEFVRQERASQAALDAIAAIRGDDSSSTQKSQYELVNERECHRSENTVNCEITCRDQHGNSFNKLVHASYIPSAKAWWNNEVSGYHYSVSSVFSEICRNN